MLNHAAQTFDGQVSNELPQADHFYTIISHIKANLTKIFCLWIIVCFSLSLAQEIIHLTFLFTVVGRRHQTPEKHLIFMRRSTPWLSYLILHVNIFAAQPKTKKQAKFINKYNQRYGRCVHEWFVLTVAWKWLNIWQRKNVTSPILVTITLTGVRECVFFLRSVWANWLCSFVSFFFNAIRLWWLCIFFRLNQK